MKQIQRNSKTLLLLAALTASSSAATTITFQGPGTLDNAAAWGGAFPVAGETGIVNINAVWPDTSGAGTLSAGGDIIIGSTTATNIILTAGTDIVGTTPTSVTFNNVTVNVNDDIFTGGAGGNFIFNSGSVTTVRDDFEANGGGTITVNGGMHTLTSAVNTSNFGAQRISTLNFLGGTVTADVFRTDAGNNAQPAGGTINIGGDATLTADAISFDDSGFVNFASDWTGSLSIAGFDAAQWEALLTAGVNETLDGTAIDAASFASDFTVTGDTLSLTNAIPEPSTALLGALGALALLRRRR